MSKWDAEYHAKGIPSSIREEPSGVLRWVLANWSCLTGRQLPRAALDVGCGTGRNSVYLAACGIDVCAFDSSAEAIRRAHARDSASAVDFRHHDLTAGLPGSEGRYDLLLDIFVYKHQLDPQARLTYRREMARVLSSSGRVLLSLAEPSDGYYSSCPPWHGNEDTDGLDAVIDANAGGIGSVLFSLSQLQEEMSDYFRLEMAWHKVKVGEMHGGKYERRTLATIWRRA